MSYIDLFSSTNMFYSLEAKGYKRLILNVTPSDATISFTATGGIKQGNNVILVPTGTSVTYSVSAAGYITETDSVTVSDNMAQNVELILENVTLTVSPTPSNATVILVADGYTQSGNSITVDYGVEVECTVSSEGYQSQTNSIRVTSDQTISVVLSGYTLTVNPVPADANVILAATGYVQKDNTITVPAGTEVRIGISKSGYETFSERYTVTQTESIPITLVQEIAFIMVGDNGQIAYTRNGSSWTTVTVGSDTWNSVAWGEGTYVAVGDSTAIISTNANSWSTVNAKGKGIIYGNDEFIAVLGDKTYTSTDETGEEWDVSPSLAENTEFTDISYGSSKYVIVGSSSTAGGFYSYSSNGTTWSTTYVTMTPTKVNYVQGNFITGGSSYIGVIPEGAGQFYRKNASGKIWYNATYGNNLHVVSGSAGALAKFESANSSPIKMTVGSKAWYGVSYREILGVKYFIAVGEDGYITTSADGSTWTTPVQVGTSTWRDIVAVNV